VWPWCAREAWNGFTVYTPAAGGQTGCIYMDVSDTGSRQVQGSISRLSMFTRLRSPSTPPANWSHDLREGNGPKGPRSGAADAGQQNGVSSKAGIHYVFLDAIHFFHSPPRPYDRRDRVSGVRPFSDHTSRARKRKGNFTDVRRSTSVRGIRPLVA